MTNKHTPGPWKHEDSDDGFHIINDNKDWIATVHGGQDGDEENAHLIAAAPDLLEAAGISKELCDLITKWCDADRYDAETIMDDIIAIAQDDKRAEKAINKATGKS